LLGAFHDTGCDAGEVRVGDVVNDDTDDLEVTTHHRLCSGVGRVVELRGCGQYPLAQLFTDDTGAPVEDARRRRQRDPCLARYVGERRGTVHGVRPPFSEYTSGKGYPETMSLPDRAGLTSDPP
jgi:hypothetical protein